MALPEAAQYALSFALALAAGFIGPITGGGGLISVPGLMLLGLSPESAIATTRLGALGLWISAISHYQRKRLIDWRLSSHLAILGVLGGYLGSTLLLYFRNYDLDTIVATLLLVMLVILLGSKRKALQAATPTRFRKGIGYVLFFLVMIFSGFFSGGDGTLGIFVLVLCFGLNVVSANAVRGPAWLAMGIIACSKYVSAGIIDPEFALTQFVGMAIGANLGARTAIRKGEGWVQIMLGVVVVLLVAKLVLS